MARPSKLTEQLIGEFVATVRNTGNIETAISQTGIGRATFYRWKHRVEDGKGDKLQRKLIRQIEQALADCTKFMEGCILTAAPKNWQCAAWWLERRHPSLYGRKRPY